MKSGKPVLQGGAMRTAWIIGCALLLGACDKKNNVICLDLSDLPVGGAGGEGGTSGGTGGTTTNSTGCVPGLREEIGCFEPDAVCCDIDSPGLKCEAATEGVYPTPFFCADPTKALSASCVVVENGDTTCAWGKSQLVCCNGV